MSNQGPVEFSGDVEQDARSMMDSIDLMKQVYDRKIKMDVMPAFKKYDVDGSGSIDK